MRRAGRQLGLIAAINYEVGFESLGEADDRGLGEIRFRPEAQALHAFQTCGAVEHNLIGLAEIGAQRFGNALAHPIQFGVLRVIGETQHQNRSGLSAHANGHEQRQNQSAKQRHAPIVACAADVVGYIP